MKSVAIIVLAGCLAFTAARLAEVENQRHAMITGLCPIDLSNPQSLDCLRNVETRISWWWNLYYGLKG